MSIPPEIYDAIAAEIHSDSSPVGIDAKKAGVQMRANRRAEQNKADLEVAKIVANSKKDSS